MRKKLLQPLILCFFITNILTISGCGLPTTRTKTGFYFDTVISVTLYSQTSDEYLDGCMELAQTYETYFSNTIPESDISILNEAAGNGEYITLHDETIELLQIGKTYAALSEGVFQITCGALTDLWDFTSDDATLPDSAALEEAISTINDDAISIQGNTARIETAGTKIDLGGLAKGYIADQMKAYLQENGITEGIINLGGNVLTVGPKKNGNTYQVGIQKPFSDGGEADAYLSVEDASLVTSGVYQRYFYLEDTLYHHILDLSTGYPVENDLLSVTILSENSVDGDALSTICFLLGKEKGLALIETIDGVEAIFLDQEQTYTFSSGAEDYFHLTEN